MKKLLGVAFLMFALGPSGWAQNKKRVAVMNFDYATVRSSVAAIFGGDEDMGKGIADLLVTRLVNDGVYSVIERKALDKIPAEQNFFNGDCANPDTAAKIGRGLGVEGIIERRSFSSATGKLWIFAASGHLVVFEQHVAVHEQS
jgi:curli biogenesis system outer membrane secretion channel CsgG